MLDSNLRYAHLEGVNFHEANLQGADLHRAFVGYTIFADVDFNDAIGLETIQHRASSSIDIHTLYKSQGTISEVFLRGCGVPDQMIEYARSLTTIPIQYYSCFISYSHKDEELAQRIHTIFRLPVSGAGLRLMTVKLVIKSDQLSMNPSGFTISFSLFYPNTPSRATG